MKSSNEPRTGLAAAPRPPDEALRLAALDAYEAFGTPPEERFERITRMLARSLRVPIALVSLVGEDRQWFKSCIGLPGVDGTGRGVAFCAYAILQNGVMVVEDATQDPRFAANPLVTGWPHIRFYAGMPLRAPDGQNVGTLCAIDTVPRTPTEEELENLRECAALVVDEFELRRSVRLLELERRALAIAEEDYRYLTECMHGMVFRVRHRPDGTFEYEYVSAGSVDLVGILPETFTQDGFSLRRLMDPWVLADALRTIDQAARERRPWLWEGPVTLLDGTEKWLRALARPQFLGGDVRWRGIFLDATVEKARERELARAKENAERASKVKGEFLSRMSHELRTPLNAILGFVQTLSLEPLERDAREDVREIEPAGHHLLSLINEVLDLGSDDRIPQTRTFEPVDVCEVLSEVYGLLRPLLDAQRVRLRAVHRPDGACVHADPKALRQGAIYVITNAIKYNRLGGHVRVRVGADADGRISIAIADEGPGIAPERLSRLFDPFDRLGAEATDVEGTGLGLAITKGLVERMGGELDVVSEVGKGSTFTFLIPAAVAA